MVRRIARGQWLWFVMALFLLDSAIAGKIIWRSLARPHETSAGMPLTSEMVFQLGVFADGFVPTASNVGRWSDHWHVAAETAFNESEERFSDTFVVASNAPPFRSGTQGYVWGRQGREWVLMTGDRWRWPSQDPLAFAVTWSTLSMDRVIVGEVSEDATETHLRTAYIPVGVTRSAWSAQHETLDWLADPDGDGLTNQLEYALDRNPQQFDLEPPLEVSEEGQVILRQNPGSEVSLSLEFSDDLKSWSSTLPSSWALVSETPSGCVYARGANPEQVFVRVRADW